MAAKVASVKAAGMKHLIGGHYGATVAGKQVLVKLPVNADKPESGGGMDVYPDWLVEELPELSEVQKEYAEFVKNGGKKDVGGGNANATE